MLWVEMKKEMNLKDEAIYSITFYFENKVNLWIKYSKNLKPYLGLKKRDGKLT